ncbi:MAG: hypothetical protein ABII27_08915 [bacterium]
MLRSAGVWKEVLNMSRTYFGHEKLVITGAELSKYFGVAKSSISSAICLGRKIAYENEYRII